MMDELEKIEQEIIWENAGDLFNRTERNSSQEYTEFYEDLVTIINQYNQIRHSNTPAHLLANYLLGCLESFEYAVNKRDVWWEHFPNIMDDEREFE
jgi:hypothetical protein